MPTSGQVVDFYDDLEKTDFKSFFPTFESVPPLIKEAHILSSNEREKLPDTVFALVMHDGEHVQRKFACSSPAEVTLSTLYLIKNAHKLPPTAQKVAAENLLTACDWYGLDKPEELKKLAMVGQALGMLSATSSVGDVVGGFKKPVTAVPGVKLPGQ